MTQEKHPEEFADLEPLEEPLEPLAELEPLDEPLAEAPLEELPVEPPPAPAPVKPVVTPKAKDEGKGADKSEKEPERPKVEPGQKRELEQAPLLLRKASMILLVGSLFPWLHAVMADIEWGPLMGAKAIALVAAWIFHQGYVATHGGKAVDFIDKLAKAHPIVPQAVAGVVAIGAFVLLFASGMSTAVKALAEVATLLLATSTFSHIFGYEHGGKFNPLFPLMFLGPGLAGGLSALGVFPENIVGGIGCLIVAVGGLMAMYVMFVAMKQAKVEGDMKREAMRQQRKAQRAAKRGSTASS